MKGWLVVVWHVCVGEGEEEEEGRKGRQGGKSGEGKRVTCVCFDTCSSGVWFRYVVGWIDRCILLPCFRDIKVVNCGKWDVMWCVTWTYECIGESEWTDQG